MQCTPAAVVNIDPQGWPRITYTCTHIIPEMLRNAASLVNCMGMAAHTPPLHHAAAAQRILRLPSALRSSQSNQMYTQGSRQQF